MAGDAPVVDRVELAGDAATHPSFDTEAWKSAAFLDEAVALVAKTTAMPKISVPGTSLSVGTRLIDLEGSTLTAFGGLDTIETAKEQR